jgi:hypothetical protein
MAYFYPLLELKSGFDTRIFSCGKFDFKSKKSLQYNILEYTPIEGFEPSTLGLTVPRSTS